MVTSRNSKKGKKSVKAGGKSHGAKAKPTTASSEDDSNPPSDSPNKTEVASVPASNKVQNSTTTAKNPKFPSAAELEKKPAPVIFSSSIPKKRKTAKQTLINTTATPTKKQPTVGGCDSSPSAMSLTTSHSTSATSVATSPGSPSVASPANSKDTAIDVDCLTSPTATTPMAAMGFVARKKKPNYHGIYIRAVVIKEPDNASVTLFRLEDPHKKPWQSTYMEWNFVQLPKTHPEFAEANNLGEPYLLWFHDNLPMQNERGYKIRLYPVSSMETPSSEAVFELASRIGTVLTQTGKLTKPKPMDEGFFWIPHEKTPVWSDVIGKEEAFDKLIKEIGCPPGGEVDNLEFYTKNLKMIWCYFRFHEMTVKMKKYFGVPSANETRPPAIIKDKPVERLTEAEVLAAEEHVDRFGSIEDQYKPGTDEELEDELEFQAEKRAEDAAEAASMVNEEGFL